MTLRIVDADGTDITEGRPALERDPAEGTVLAIEGRVGAEDAENGT